MFFITTSLLSLLLHIYAYIREFYEVPDMLLPSFVISRHISFSDLDCYEFPVHIALQSTTLGESLGDCSTRWCNDPSARWQLSYKLKFALGFHIRLSKV